MMLVVTSCQSLKNAVSGVRQENSDEFLVQKKNPLVLPPDFTDLPVPFEQNSVYNFITILIIVINLVILIMIIKSNDIKAYFLMLILGGSSGNLFDRMYYSAVPDFIDFHINDFHWFIFNVADVFISVGVICLIIVEFIFNKTSKK